MSISSYPAQTGFFWLLVVSGGFLIVPTLQRGNGVLTLQRHRAGHRENPAVAGQHAPAFAKHHTMPASPTDPCPSGDGPSIARLRFRLGQPGMHRKHPMALDQTGRWSVLGCGPTLERGNDQSQPSHISAPPSQERSRQRADQHARSGLPQARPMLPALSSGGASDSYARYLILLSVIPLAGAVFGWPPRAPRTHRRILHCIWHSAV